MRQLVERTYRLVSNFCWTAAPLVALGCAADGFNANADEIERKAATEDVGSTSQALTPVIDYYDGGPVSVPGGSSSGNLLNCPSGRKVTGGGFYNFYALQMKAATLATLGTTWFTEGQNPTSGPLEYTPEVICLAHPTATVSTVSNSFSIPAYATSLCQTMTCPAGKVATGGGFQAASALNVHGSYVNANGTGWTACARNGTGLPAYLWVDVQCLSLPGASVSRVISPLQSIPLGGGSATAFADCPTGRRVSGTGFYVPPTNSVILSSDSWNTRSRAVARSTATSGPTGNVQAIAACLSVP